MAKESKQPNKTKTKTKSKKNNKNLIIGICCALALVIIVIVAIVLINQNKGISDSYFVSDGSKYVLTIESDDQSTLETDSDENTPLKTHLVYTYEGDTITGLKSYYEYADANAAKSALEAIKESLADSEESIQIEQNGKYLIVTAEEDAYKDMTASDVKQQIEFMEMLKNMSSDDLSDAEDADDIIEYGDEEDIEETE